MLRVSSAEKLNLASLSADIINEKGVVLLSDVALADVEGTMQATINPPVGKFKVALKGMTSKGDAFQRISPRLSEANNAFMMIISAGDEFTASVASGGSKIEVFAFNQAAPESFTFGATASYGTVVADVRSRIIGRASNVTVGFTYYPSRSPVLGKTDTITITGTGHRSTRMQIPVSVLLVA